MNQVIPLGQQLGGGANPPVVFTRQELQVILNLYSFMVGKGEWRDYAMSGGPDHASFAVFRHAAEAPLYIIEKRRKKGKKPGGYFVLAPGRIVKRGDELATVLKVFDRKRFSVVD